METYLDEQRIELQATADLIRAKQVELSSAIAASEVIVQLGNRNNAASRVVGRISLFVEGLVPEREIARLEGEHRRLKGRVADLEQRIGADDSGAKLASTLNNISMHMGGYVSALGAEFSEYPARLDLHNLTVALDRPGRPILMQRTGGGERSAASTS